MLIGPSLDGGESAMVKELFNEEMEEANDAAAAALHAEIGQELSQLLEASENNQPAPDESEQSG